MLRNYLSAALRNLARNRLHSAITTISLAVGFAAVIFAVLFWRYERSYDRFWPHADNLYLAVQEVTAPGRAPKMGDGAPIGLGPLLAAEVPGVEAAARVAFGTATLEHGEVSGVESQVLWADINLFDVLTPRLVAGDLKQALAAPDAIVLTKSLARKYFGDEGALGQTLTVSRTAGAPTALRVTAIIEDMPPNSHLMATGFISGLSAASPQSGGKGQALTYFRARPGARAASLGAGFESFSRRHMPAPARGSSQLRALPISQAYMRPTTLGAQFKDEMASGDAEPNGGSPISIRSEGSTAWFGYAILAGGMLVIAAINFITLMTARGAGRAVEVGVRKVSGARRRDLVVQFIGEALVYASLALVLALALVELFMPWAGKAMGRPINFDYADARLLGGLVLAALGMGAVAGFYPALALSAFRPVTVLKGGLAKTPGSARLRKILIAVQFTPLLLLAIIAVRQEALSRHFVETSYSRLDPESVLIMQPCTPGLRDRIAALPGVRSAVCTPIYRLGAGAEGINIDVGVQRDSVDARRGGGDTIEIETSMAERADLDFHGVKAVAGRLWSGPEDQKLILLSAHSAQRLGFSSPASAVGKTIEWRSTAKDPWVSSTVGGVVADKTRYDSLLYFQYPAAKLVKQIGVRLTGRDVEQTLSAMDAIWQETGGRGDMRRTYWRDEVMTVFEGERDSNGLTSVIILVGLAVAFAGLFGLATFLAEQRTKEVGIRKALGATRGRLLAMLVFQFAMPVLIANLIAGAVLAAALPLLQPTVAPDMREGLRLADFAPVLLGSLAITVLATFSHAWRVTGARPVTALRYE